MSLFQTVELQNNLILYQMVIQWTIVFPLVSNRVTSGSSRESKKGVVIKRYVNKQNVTVV